MPTSKLHHSVLIANKYAWMREIALDELRICASLWILVVQNQQHEEQTNDQDRSLLHPRSDCSYRR